MPSSVRLLHLRIGMAFIFLGLTLCSRATPWFYWVRQADDGLPGDNVTGVAQTKDGYLWIATQSGLARFDGVRIQSVPLPVGRPHPIIRAMLLDRDERLWLALEGGTVVRHASDGSKLLSTANGLVRSQPVDMAQTSDGAIWLSYLDGTACRIENDKGKHHDENDGLAGTGTCSLAGDTAGQLWFAKAGQVGTFNKGKFVSRFPLGERYIFVETARKSGIWICAGNRLMTCDGKNAPVEVGIIPADAAIVRPTAIHEDATGAVWIGTASGGLFRYDGTNIIAVETSHGRIRSVTDDREGNIWVGTDGGGLNRLRHQVVEVQGKDAGLPFDTVRSICEDTAGRLWVVMPTGDVARNEGEGWTTISSATDWPGGQATSVACDTNGVVWFGMYSRGLYRWENGRYTIIRRRDGLAGSGVRCLLADRAGNLWITFATGEVLQRYREGKFQDYALPVGSKAVRSIAEDAVGNVWLANLDAQLLSVIGDKVVEQTERTSEPFRPIRCLVGTPDGSLWIGYSSVGVGRLKGDTFSMIGTEKGLQDGSICERKQ